jgi:hypothetical protein
LRYRYGSHPLFNKKVKSLRPIPQTSSPRGGVRISIVGISAANALDIKRQQMARFLGVFLIWRNVWEE